MRSLEIQNEAVVGNLGLRSAPEGPLAARLTRCYPEAIGRIDRERQKNSEDLVERGRIYLLDTNKYCIEDVGSDPVEMGRSTSLARQPWFKHRKRFPPSLKMT